MTTVVAAVIERNGRILICQRRPTGPHPDKWEFPGGKVEPGEEPQDALRRELREELAIEADIGPEITRYEYAYSGKAPILLIFLRVTAFTGEIRNCVFQRIGWESPAALPRFDFLEGDLDFVATLATGLSHPGHG